MKSSLGSKIAVAMWAMTAAGTIASAILTGTLLVRSHRESARQALQATATSLLTLGITHYSDLEDFGDLNRFIEDSLQMDRVDKVIRVYDSSKKLQFTTAGADYDKLPTTLAKEIKKPIFMELEGVRRRYEGLVGPYESANEKQYYLQVVIPLPPYFEILAHLWWQTVLMLGLLIGLSVSISRLLARRLLTPVGVIANHLEEMDPVRIDSWKKLHPGKEGGYLSSISDGINHLSERTKAAIMRLRKMSRYVAHEMRTPLTIIQGEAETVLMKRDATPDEYRAVLKSSLEEIGRMSEIVDTVLQVGEENTSTPFVNPTSIDLPTWLKENIPIWERALGKNISLHGVEKASLRVQADPKLLFRLIDNLVRNVREHAAHSPACLISVQSDERGTSLSISDAGPGISEEGMTSLNRDEGLSDLAGIGLNLCFRIAEMSGLSLRFQSREGGGLKVEIEFIGNRG